MKVFFIFPYDYFLRYSSGAKTIYDGSGSAKRRRQVKVKGKRRLSSYALIGPPQERRRHFFGGGSAWEVGLRLDATQAESGPVVSSSRLLGGVESAEPFSGLGGGISDLRGESSPWSLSHSSEARIFGLRHRSQISTNLEPKRSGWRLEGERESAMNGLGKREIADGLGRKRMPQEEREEG